MSRSDLPPPYQPHDFLLGAAMRCAAWVDSFGRLLLSAPVRAQLSDAPLLRHNIDLVSANSRVYRTDGLLEAQHIDGGRVWILPEAKSHPDSGTALQIFNYMAQIWQWESARFGTTRLSPVLPAVVYSGRRVWRPPLSMGDLIAAPGRQDPKRWEIWRRMGGAAAGADPLRAFAGSMRFAFHDLERADIAGDYPDPQVIAVLHGLVLRAPNADRIKAIFEALPDDVHLAMAMVWYIARVVPGMTRAMVAAIARNGKLKPKTERAMQTQEGIDAAMKDFVSVMSPNFPARLRAEGKAETLCRQLQIRFGPLSGKSRAAILDASPEQLDAWLEAVLQAGSIDEVLRNGAA